MDSTPGRQIFVRPKSEIITVLDWQQVSNGTNDRFTDETCLDAAFFKTWEDRHEHKIGYVSGSYEITLDRKEEFDGDKEITEVKDADIPGKNDFEVKTNALDASPEPNQTKETQRIVEVQSSVAQKIDMDEITASTRIRYRRKGSLDASLAKLRHEMNALRRQDMMLMQQLLTLNNQIQDFKLSQCAAWLEGSSDESEITGTLMQKPLTSKRCYSQGSLVVDRSDQSEPAMEKPLKSKRRRCQGNLGPNKTCNESSNRAKEKPLEQRRWHSQGNLLTRDMVEPGTPRRWFSRASLGSDGSDHSEMALEKQLSSKRWLLGACRDSDGSDYHSASSRSSMTSGSNPSLCGSDVAGFDSGHESSMSYRGGQRWSKEKNRPGSLRRVSFGNVKEYGESEAILPPQSIRRYSDFRVAEVKPIMPLSSLQSTIW